MIADLHPFFVHFPVALYSAALVIEITRLFKKDIPNYFSVALICGGAVMGLISGLSGDLASREAERIAGITSTLNNHEFAGNLMVWIGLISGFILLLVQLKNKTMPTLRWIIILALFAGVIITAFWGSQLVQEFGAGTAIISTVQ